MNIQELCDRYGLGSRKSLYSRLNALNIKLDKDSSNKSYATAEQIEELDRLNEHLKSGGNLKNYVPLTQVTIESTTIQYDENQEISGIVETTQHSTQLEITPQLLVYLDAIASKLTPSDPLWYMNILERAIAQEWELTTSQVQELIGVKPRCRKGEKSYKRGSFIFLKSGKIGNQTAWKVFKESTLD